MKNALISWFGSLAVLMVVSLSAISIFSGCTRKEETSSITVAMPDWSKLTSKQSKTFGTLSTVRVVSRIMINVSSQDIQNQIVYVWELNDSYQDGGNLPTPPTEHTLTVPRGSNRLIQVLAIIEDIDTASSGGGGGGAMMFYYGETLKSIANVVEPVTIALSPESTVSAGDGSISGRYFFADGSTPTGTVDMYYAPTGRRPMIVESTGIFSGHFHFFLLPTVPFTFRMRSTGVALFENVTTNSFASRYSDRLLQIAVPASYLDHGGGMRHFRAAQTKVVGFAGPGATLVGRGVCYPTPSGPLPDMYDAATGGNEILWSPASTLATEARILGGGIGTPNGECSAYTAIGINSYSISIDKLMNGDSPIGNRGPFELFDLGEGRGDSFLEVAANNGKLEIKWKYLAEVVGNSVDGVGIFKKVFPASESMEDRWHDKAPCNQLSSFGFTEISRVPAGSSGNPIQSYDWTNPNLTAFNAGRLKTVVCPYTNSRPGYYDFALSHYQRSGGSGGGPTATKLSVSAVTEPTVVTSEAVRQQVSESTCTVLKIATTDSAGNVLPRANTTGSPQVSVEVLGAPPGVKLYSDINCTSPSEGASTLQPYLFKNATAIGVLATNVGPPDRSLTVTDITVGGLPLPTLTHYVARISPQSANEIRTVVSTNIKSWQCYPIGFVRGKANGANFIGESGSTGTLFVAPVQNVSYYNDDNCSSTASPGVYLAANQSYSRRFFRYIGADPSINLTPDITGFPGLTQGSTAINVTPPAAPTRLQFEISNNLTVNDCHEFKIVAVNGQGEYSPLPTSQIVTYNFSTAPGSNEGIFSDDDCEMSAQGSVLIATGMAKSATYYFRWSNAISPLTIGGTSSLPVSSVNVTTVSPP